MPDSVMLAYCHPAEVCAQFHQSVVRFLLHDNLNEGYVVRGGGHMGIQSGPRIAAARNQMVRHFLGHPTKPDWLWMVDADMVFRPDALHNLVKYADKYTRPIMGGLCFAGGRAGQVFPTLYSLVRGENGQVDLDRRHDYPADTVCKVDGTGAAFLLMHRRVLTEIGERVGGSHPWFAEGEVMGRECGEDLVFCLRAHALGIPIHVNTAVKIGHVKPQVIDEESFREYQQMVADGVDTEARNFARLGVPVG